MNESLSKIIKSAGSASAVVGAVTFGAGLGIGYILGRRNRNELKFESNPHVGLVLKAEDLPRFKDAHQIDAEVEALEDDDQDTDDDEDDDEEDEDESETHASAVDFINKHLKETIPPVEEFETIEQIVEITPEPELIQSNVFANTTPGWDYEEELAKRKANPEVPYIIHEDEFHNEESGFHQSSLTWYEGDRTLSDEVGQPIYAIRDIIGELKFGHGSTDPNIFFVRNENSRQEYEVIFDAGHFAVERLGLEMEETSRSQDLKAAHGPKRFPQV